jgi:hypothetical protein
MDVFALSLQLKEEGAATVKAAIDKLNRSFDDGVKKGQAYDLTIGSLKNQMQNLVSGFALAAVFGKIITETTGAEFATAQLNAALKSTQGVAGQSAEALNLHAQALSMVSKFDDDAITGAQALLLTFTKIHGETFPKATQAIVDMATAMNTDLKSATIQVGKALNDPILGVGALARAGVQFSEAQKEVIASLVETGRIAEAQTVILKELETQFGGSAEAAANTFGGAISRLNNELGNLLTLSSNNSNVAVSFINLLTDALIGLNSRVSKLGQLLNDLKTPFGGLLDMLGRFVVPNRMLRLLSAIGRAQREATTAAAAAQQGAPAFRSGLEDAFQQVKQRQIEIGQLVQLAEVKTLNASQTRILREEAARLTKEMDRQGLSMQSQYELGKKLLEINKALEVKGPAKKPLKLAEVSGIGVPFMQQQKLPLMESAFAAMTPTAIPQEAKDAMRKISAALEPDFVAGFQEMTDRVALSMGNALVDSVSAAFENLTAVGGSIKSAFSVLTSGLLAGLGSMLIEFGRYVIVAGKLMAAVKASLSSMNPIAGVAAGLAMIAVGGMLRGAASRTFGGVPNGGGNLSGFTGGTMAGGGTMRLPGVFYGPTSAGGAGQIQPMPNMNVTIIGPNDPSAQRQMQELMRNAQRRGTV